MPPDVHLSETDYQRVLADGFGAFEWLYPDLTGSLVEIESAPSGPSWRGRVLRGLMALRFDLLDYYATLENLDDSGVGWARALRRQLADILSELHALFRAISHPGHREDVDLMAWALAVCERVRAETAGRTAGGMG